MRFVHTLIICLLLSLHLEVLSIEETSPTQKSEKQKVEEKLKNKLNALGLNDEKISEYEGLIQRASKVLTEEDLEIVEKHCGQDIRQSLKTQLKGKNLNRENINLQDVETIEKYIDTKSIIYSCFKKVNKEVGIIRKFLKSFFVKSPPLS